MLRGEEVLIWNIHSTYIQEVEMLLKVSHTTKLKQVQFECVFDRRRVLMVLKGGQKETAELDADNELCKLQSLLFTTCLNGASPRSACSTSRTIWESSCCSHGAPRISCPQRAPGSRLQTRLGEHKAPRDVSGHQVKQISVVEPKDQLKRGQGENSVPSPVLGFSARQTRKPEKKINKRR